ncbi:MAG: C40 family peptidase [Pseudomonadota bacterium]
MQAVVISKILRLFFALSALALAACGQWPQQTSGESSARGSEVALFALGLLDTGYRFGGKNPEAGLDCSGMVSYVFAQAAQMQLSGNAASLARLGRAVQTHALSPGDLVFFNTLSSPWSHVGIYVGDGRFIHAPSSQGRVRLDSLKQAYYAQRLTTARRYFD